MTNDIVIDLEACTSNYNLPTYNSWHFGELESRRELAGGLGRRFDNADDAIRWLISND